MVTQPIEHSDKMTIDIFNAKKRFGCILEPSYSKLPDDRRPDERLMIEPRKDHMYGPVCVSGCNNHQRRCDVL